MSYITIDNINSINAELSNYCNAACPMCARYDWGIDLIKGKTNSHNTSLELIQNKIGIEIISKEILFLWHLWGWSSESRMS